MRRLAALAFALCTTGATAAELPIFDAHIHYSHDAWENLPPAQAIDVLRKAGLRRALVSSSGDDGTQRLAAAAPDLILPSLRPYRSRADVGTWVRDETVIAFLEDRLAKQRYVAIGEFHVFGADADLPVMRRTVELAKRHDVVLHLHGDADAVERVYRQYPQARILWAHSGFVEPSAVREMLRKHDNLWCDLAFRSDPAAGGKVRPEWRALFEAFPDRFMVGTDTYTPERWLYVGEHAKWAREWLADLPPALAERIAWRNGEALFAKAIRSTL
ncbi:MAG TPA: amidohydrolase family protein [Casimicrobiaceae bacterium]|nr:amidohydrolase family protein [Casimicrobiaceae bacterium]